MKIGQIHQAISKLLEARLAPLITDGRDLNLTSCVEFYTTIFEVLAEVIESAGLPIDNEGVNYLAQQYYDGIVVNNGQTLDPDIFTQRAKLENIETKELALMAVILSGTDFAVPIIQEIKRRS